MRTFISTFGRSPLPEPVFGGVLSDVRAQFDRALTKMYELNDSSSQLLNESKSNLPDTTETTVTADQPMKIDELNLSKASVRSISNYNMASRTASLRRSRGKFGNFSTIGTKNFFRNLVFHVYF